MSDMSRIEKAAKELLDSHVQRRLSMRHFAALATEIYGENSETAEFMWGEYRKALSRKQAYNASKEKMTPVIDPSQIPEHMTEAETERFWDSHYATEELLGKLPDATEDERPGGGE